MTSTTMVIQEIKENVNLTRTVCCATNNKRESSDSNTNIALLSVESRQSKIQRKSKNSPLHSSGQVIPQNSLFVAAPAGLIFITLAATTSSVQIVPKSTLFVATADGKILTFTAANSSEDFVTPAGPQQMHFTCCEPKTENIQETCTGQSTKSTRQDDNVITVVSQITPLSKTKPTSVSLEKTTELNVAFNLSTISSSSFNSQPIAQPISLTNTKNTNPAKRNPLYKKDKSTYNHCLGISKATPLCKCFYLSCSLFFFL